MHGKMGICIFFYHLARKTGDKNYEEFAGELLDEIFEEIDIKTPLDFENGLTGIGWGIEYLVQNGFAEGDTNEILAAIDNSVLGGILARPFTIMDDQEIYSIGLYYLARLKGKESADDNLSLLRIKTHMVYLLEDCKRLLIRKEMFNQKVPQLTVRQLCSLTYFLIETHRISLFPAATGKLIRILPEYAKNKWQCSESIIDNFTLCHLLEQIQSLNGISLTDIKTGWRKSGRFPEGENAVSEFILNTCNTLIYYTSFSDETEAGIITDLAVRHIQDVDYLSGRIKAISNDTLCLDKGLAGVGLSLLLHAYSDFERQAFIYQSDENQCNANEVVSKAH